MRVSCGGPEPNKASASVIQLAKVQSACVSQIHICLKSEIHISLIVNMVVLSRSLDTFTCLLAPAADSLAHFRFYNQKCLAH